MDNGITRQKLLQEKRVLVVLKRLLVTKSKLLKLIELITHRSIRFLKLTITSPLSLQIRLLPNQHKHKQSMLKLQWKQPQRLVLLLKSDKVKICRQVWNLVMEKVRAKAMGIRRNQHAV